jgi:hypothetical protein
MHPANALQAAAARATRRAPHKVGGLSAEEKAARLAEMQSNAEAHETDRLARLRRAEERDAAEDGESALALRIFDPMSGPIALAW